MAGLRFPSAGGFVGVKRGEQIQNAGSGDEAGAVISGGMRNVGTGEFRGAREKVKQTRTEIREVAQRGEGIFAARSEDIAAHAGSKNHKRADGEKNCERAAPHFLKRVTETGNKPTGESDGKCNQFAASLLRIRRWSGGCAGLGRIVYGFVHQFQTQARSARSSF